MNETGYEVVGNKLRVKLSDKLDHHNASIIRNKIDKLILKEQNLWIVQELALSWGDTSF